MATETQGGETSAEQGERKRYSDGLRHGGMHFRRRIRVFGGVGRLVSQVHEQGRASEQRKQVAYDASMGHNGKEGVRQVRNAECSRKLRDFASGQCVIFPEPNGIETFRTYMRAMNEPNPVPRRTSSG